MKWFWTCAELLSIAILASFLAVGCGAGEATRGLTLEPGAEAKPRAAGQVWTFAVGISKYRESALDLEFAARDAEEIDRFFATPAGGAVPASRRVLLTNAAATRADILGTFEKTTRMLGKDDLLVVFMAMHGIVTDRGDLYFAVHDTSPSNVRGTGLANADVEQAVRDAEAKHVLFLADTCHSGGVGLSGRRGVGALETNRLLASLALAKPGMAILTASRGAELSQENARWGGGHGVFTHFVLTGMAGGADENKDQLVTVSELYDFVYGRVKEATSGGQHPELKGKFDNQMPIAALGGGPVTASTSAATPAAAVAAPAGSPAGAPTGGGGKVCAFDDNDACQAECGKGNGRSCFHAGYYLLGFDPKGKMARSRDFKAAIPFLKKACDLNDGDACHYMASAHLIGEQYDTGIRMDRTKALALATKGCELGSAMSCHSLGDGWSHGSQFGEDAAKAVTYFSKACALFKYKGEGNLSLSVGHPFDRPDSCGRWAEILLRGGAGVAQDTAQAIQIRTKGCEAGDVELCWRLGDLFEDGVEPGFTAEALKDPARAVVFKKKACALGYRANDCSRL
jgi:TPR repeat protein/uncharacterized caspase-like protein